MDGKMTTFTTEDREALEKGLEFFEKLKEADKGTPIPFAGWIQDKEDIEKMLREQIYVQQKEIDRLNGEIFKLQILHAKRYVYDPDDGGNDVWIIEKKNSNEFK
jgi:hypothetical protein